MKKKIFLLAIIIIAVNFTLAQKNKGTALQQYSRVKFKVETSGDISYGKNENYSQINVAAILKELDYSQTENSWPINVSYTYTGCSTIYDFVSNGTPQSIMQDPNNANRIHLLCMSSPWGDPHPNFPGRLIKYYYSSNKGTNWTFINNLGPRAGFPQITLMANGNAMISGNVGSGSTEMARWYYDASPGLGSFTELYPAINQRFLFPRTVSTSNMTSPNKFISILSSNDLDSSFWINCTSLNPSPGLFSSSNFLNAKPAECYAIARGDDGRIGVVYITNNLLTPADIGDIYFVETTNQGNSFSSPTKIFDANISSTGDSLGAFRGISMVYQGNDAKVVFETVKQTSDGYYFPGAPAKIRFWSNSLSGIDPNRSIVIVDTSRVPFRPYISKGLNNDLFASLCRPTIGLSLCGGYYNYLFVSFMAPSNKVGGTSDSVSYMDVYLIYKNSLWESWWKNPERINPIDTNNLKDWTYPSISPTNDCNVPSNYYNLSVLSDSIPGSYINHSSNGQSLAKYYLLRGLIWVISVQPISTIIPELSKLYQNYPNPFNPSTKIKFDIPSNVNRQTSRPGGSPTNVKLFVYDILGKEVATLVNENLNAGYYETEFKGNNLSSGIYFYKLETENFTDIKRMILIK